MKSRSSYFLLMHLIVLVWGFTGILGRVIYLPADVLVWYRMGIATLSLLVILPFMRKKIFPKRKKDILHIALVGIVVTLHWITFFKAIALSTASLGVLCLSVTTFHVSWIEPLIMKRRFSKIDMLMGLSVVYAIYFISSDFQGDEWLALAYGLSSSIFAALFTVLNEKLAETISSSQIVFSEMLSGFVFLFVLLLFTGGISAASLSMTGKDLFYLLLLGAVCTGIPFILWTEVIKKLGAFSTSLIINLEPVYTMVLAVILLNENELLTSRFYIGAAWIISMVLFDSLYKNNHRWKRRFSYHYHKKI